MNPPPAPALNHHPAPPPAPVVSLPPVEPEHPHTEEPNTRLALPPGAIVGEYTIISKLGKGGFGITYRAKHTINGNIVVIKEHIPEGMAKRMPDGCSVMSISPEKEEEFTTTMAEFMEEVSILMGLEHPGIVPILTAFEANGTAYYTMPFVEGTQLQIPEHPTLDRDKKTAEARKIKQLLRSLLFTLEYLEQNNIVHRDIKPENIIVNEESRPILLDFGSARQLQSGKIFNNIYTPDFCAPEQSCSKSDAEMSSKLSVRTDIYALGACFYYLITRLLPPRADMRIHASPDPYRPLAGRKDLQLYYEPYFLQSIDRALNLSPQERWQDAATWRLCTESGIVPPPRSFMLRMRIYMAIAMGIIIILGALSIIAWREKSQTQQMYLNGLVFTEGLLHDFNTELSDLPGSTHLQRKLGTNLKNYLDSMESLPVADDARLQHSMATAWQNMGAVFVQQGKLESATEAYRKATELLENLIEGDSDNLRTRYELARTLSQRAEIARRRNLLADGRKLADRALTLMKGVCQDAPQNPDYLCALGTTMGTAAQLADNSGDMEHRRTALVEMIKLYRKLVTQYPLHVASRKGLAQAQISLASLYMDNNDFNTADILLNESKDILYSLSDEAPHRLSFRQGLAAAYYTIGLMNNRQSLSAKDENQIKDFNILAQTALEECIEICRQLESVDRDNAEYPFQQCRALTHLADIAMRKNEYPAAERYNSEALARIKILLETAPNNVEYAQILAGVVRNLAMVHSKQESSKAKATAEFAEYRDIVRNLLAQSPNNPSLKYMYADALTESATHARTMGDNASAEIWLHEAEMFLDKLSPNGIFNNLWAKRLKTVRDMINDITHPVEKTVFPPQRK
ncbi:MAG: protein kinase [Akkermansia sp.]|nr:protein kinase [Akkermansia sp.]